MVGYENNLLSDGIFHLSIKKIEGNKGVVPRGVSKRASATVVIDLGAGYMNMFNL